MLRRFHELKYISTLIRVLVYYMLLIFIAQVLLLRYITIRLILSFDILHDLICTCMTRIIVMSCYYNKLINKRNY